MTDEKIMATIKPDGECWQPELEKMPRKQLEELQVKKLKDTIKVCLQSPFYKKRLGELGITADSINSLEDLRKIPFSAAICPRRNPPVWMLESAGTVDSQSNVSLSTPSTAMGVTKVCHSPTGAREEARVRRL